MIKKRIRISTSCSNDIYILSRTSSTFIDRSVSDLQIGGKELNLNVKTFAHQVLLYLNNLINY